MPNNYLKVFDWLFSCQVMQMSAFTATCLLTPPNSLGKNQVELCPPSRQPIKTKRRKKTEQKQIRPRPDTCYYVYALSFCTLIVRLYGYCSRISTTLRQEKGDQCVTVPRVRKCQSGTETGTGTGMQLSALFDLLK